jgi:hypothetical protein
VTGPAKEIESDMRRPKGDSRFLVGKRPNIGPQGRFIGADPLHESFLTTVAPGTHSPRDACVLSAKVDAGFAPESTTK